MASDNRTLDMTLGGVPSTYVLGPLAGLELARFVTAGTPLYIIDETVAAQHPGWIEQVQQNCSEQAPRVLILPGGEGAKTIGELGRVYEWLAESALPRDGTLVGIGGGTILDLAGLAASTWRRGVNFVAIPTTLLAMVDAAIGGKTAINTAGLKNPVGTFHPARGILADVCFLGTLAARDWRDGLAEMIKTAAIGAPDLFHEMVAQREKLHRTIGTAPGGEPIAGILGTVPWRDWVARSAAVKVDIVNKDFRESGLRKALNLGHTLGHVLEAHSHATDRPLSHGQAVSIGMAVVFRISAERGIFPVQEALGLIDLLQCCGLPITWPAPPALEIDRLLAGDKKGSARDGLRWVLPERLGKMDVAARISTEELLRWLD